MLYLLIAAALCVFVPWLPVWMYRRLPRRPPPPLSEHELHRLAGTLQPPPSPEMVEPVAAEDDRLSADISRPPTTRPGAAGQRVEDPTGPEIGQPSSRS